MDGDAVSVSAAGSSGEATGASATISYAMPLLLKVKSFRPWSEWSKTLSNSFVDAKSEVLMQSAICITAFSTSAFVFPQDSSCCPPPCARTESAVPVMLSFHTSTFMVPASWETVQPSYSLTFVSMRSKSCSIFSSSVGSINSGSLVAPQAQRNRARITPRINEYVFFFNYIPLSL